MSTYEHTTNSDLLSFLALPFCPHISFSSTPLVSLSSVWYNMFYLYVLPPRDFNTTPFSLPLGPTSVYPLMLEVLQTQSRDCSKTSTFIRISLYTILVPLLCLCQGVIAEDTREGLSSCPFEATMVTCSYSCGALQICKYTTSSSLATCWPDA